MRSPFCALHGPLTLLLYYIFLTFVTSGEFQGTPFPMHSR